MTRNRTYRSRSGWGFTSAREGMVTPIRDMDVTDEGETSRMRHGVSWIAEDHPAVWANPSAFTSRVTRTRARARTTRPRATARRSNRGISPAARERRIAELNARAAASTGSKRWALAPSWHLHRTSSAETLTERNLRVAGRR
jgi:hypothetical protein